MEQETKTVEVTQETQTTEIKDVVETPKEKEHVKETPQIKSSEVLRELAKVFSVNFFDDPEAVKVVAERVHKTNEELGTLKKDKETLTAKTQEYETKVSALALGFAPESIDEVLALAKVNVKDGQTITDGLKVVKEKYGSVFATRTNIGTQSKDIKGDKLDLPKTEQEAYLARSKKVQAWQQKNKK